MPNFEIEDGLKGHICGLDEVGRGPLAGPVMAACVYIPESMRTLPLWSMVDDSKKLNASKRTDLAHQIEQVAWTGLGLATVYEIDTHNILQASFIAMRRAYDDMMKRYPQSVIDHALIDGNRKPAIFPVPVTTIIQGDRRSVSIAAASIIAKTARDRLMNDLHNEYPVYGWAKNAGYGTAAHMAALTAHGPCPHHRQSFAPIRQLKMINNK